MERMHERHSPAVEDYAKAIYTLQEQAEGPVTTTALAERLGVAINQPSRTLLRVRPRR